MTCRLFQMQLVDYLYGELTSSEQAACKQHLAECTSCQTLARSFESTRQTTRAALNGPLNEAPSAEAHRRLVAIVLENSVQTEIKAWRKPQFFAQMLRKPWVFPAYGAVAIVAFFFLVRTHHKTDLIPGQKATPLDESSLRQGVHPTDIPTAEPAQEQTMRDQTALPSKALSKRMTSFQGEKPAAKPTSNRDKPTGRGANKNLQDENKETPALYQAAPSQMEAAGHARLTNLTSLEEMIHQADSHFQTKRWSEAKNAYQTLIRLYPEHLYVESWRQRLNQAIAQVSK